MNFDVFQESEKATTILKLTAKLLLMLLRDEPEIVQDYVDQLGG